MDQILNVVESSNSSDILEQIKVELLKQNKDAYEQWRQGNFNESYLFESLAEHNTWLLMSTLLHMATGNSHLNTVKIPCRRKNVDINRASFYLDKAGDCSQHFFSEGDYGNDNALHLVAESGNLGLVKYLAGKENVEINKSKS
ncbi:hypothetical protein [Wolbachia endosymbiont of Mansonella perstans]|uniref:hypothetical protein n=1 Tax=Wolbachia endosymbiont of Mansonella perstans TaxID=229526 RepID=UPI001CE1EBF7|nr:hypothetical protein [Wolbachia endosymbiont of Mansonella perstans]MCA4773953.1 hypothetical protein [Wolbachia endosymbiont of Mansonella perstans]